MLLDVPDQFLLAEMEHLLNVQFRDVNAYRNGALGCP